MRMWNGRDALEYALETFGYADNRVTLEKPVTKPMTKSAPSRLPEIKNVIFNEPATIVLWKDGTKTVVKCQEGDEYSKYTGLALCIAKKALGNKGNFNETFKKWIPEEDEESDVQQDDPFKELRKACKEFADAVTHT